jgi:hypothetical protein
MATRDAGPMTTRDRSTVRLHRCGPCGPDRPSGLSGEGDRPTTREHLRLIMDRYNRDAEEEAALTSPPPLERSELPTTPVCAHDNREEERGQSTCLRCGKIFNRPMLLIDKDAYGVARDPTAADRNRRRRATCSVYDEIPAYVDRAVKNLAVDMYKRATRGHVFRNVGRRAIIFGCLHRAARRLGRDARIDAVLRTFELTAHAANRGIAYVWNNNNDDDAVEGVGDVVAMLPPHADDRSHLRSMLHALRRMSTPLRPDVRSIGRTEESSSSGPPRDDDDEDFARAWSIVNIVRSASNLFNESHSRSVIGGCVAFYVLDVVPAIMIVRQASAAKPIGYTRRLSDLGASPVIMRVKDIARLCQLADSTMGRKYVAVKKTIFNRGGLCIKRLFGELLTRAFANTDGQHGAGDRGLSVQSGKVDRPSGLSDAVDRPSGLSDAVDPASAKSIVCHSPIIAFIDAVGERTIVTAYDDVDHMSIVSEYTRFAYPLDDVDDVMDWNLLLNEQTYTNDTRQVTLSARLLETSRELRVVTRSITDAQFVDASIARSLARVMGVA